MLNQNSMKKDEPVLQTGKEPNLFKSSTSINQCLYHVEIKNHHRGYRDIQEDGATLLFK
jgi:hypothetical protein